MNMKMLAVGLIGGAATMVAIVPAALAANDGNGSPASSAATEQHAPRMRMAQDGASGTMPMPGPGRMGMRGPGGHLNIMEAAAAALGMTGDELKAELDAGKTILDVASAKGVDAATLTSKVTAALKAEIESKLAAGEITQEQADHMLGELDQHVADALSGTRPAGGPGGHGPKGGGCDGDGDGAPSDSSDSTQDQPASTRA